MSETNFQALEKPELASGHAGVAVLALVGSADVAGGASLDKQLNAIADRRPKHVVFDLSHLKYISSICLSLILKFRAAASSGWGGKVTLAAPNDMIAGTLRHAMLDKVLTIEPSVALALAAGD